MNQKLLYLIIAMSSLVLLVFATALYFFDENSISVFTPIALLLISLEPIRFLLTKKKDGG